MIDRLAFNVSEAAEALGVSRKFFYDHCLCQPGFPVLRLGRKVLIPCTALSDWVEEQAEKGEMK